MITAKHTRCQRWTWAYVSRYGPLTVGEIPCGTYTRTEIIEALIDCGHVECVGGLWRAVTPFLGVIS